MSLQKSQQLSKNKTGLNILVVDDDSLNQRLLSIVLTRDNHIVTSAYDANEALDAITENPFDLIFMDIQIPGMDGFEVSKHIRESKSPNSQTSIVVLTALPSDHKILQDYLDNGLINDCIFKPFEANRIEQVIASIQAGKGITHTRSSHATSIDVTKASILETKNVLPFFSNDLDKYKQLFEEFLQTLPDRIEKMQKCEEKEDWPSLSTHAHNLTGVARNFGAVKLSALAHQLDKETDKKNISVIHELLKKIETNIPLLKVAFMDTIKKLNTIN